MLKMAPFSDFLLIAAVAIWGKYLRTFERFYLAPSENDMNYWALSYY